MKALAALLLAAAAAHAQLTTASPAVQAACAPTAATPLPDDMANLPVPASYPTCDSYSLYEKKDYASARACAIQERRALLARLPDSPAQAEPADASNDGGEPAGGLVVLAQLYANAEVVDRNPALAARFFCEAIDTNEVEHNPYPDPDPGPYTLGILAVLQRLREITPASPHFELCHTSGSNFPDDTTSQPPDGTPDTRYCNRKSDAERDAQYPAMHWGGIKGADDQADKDADADAAELKPALRRLTPIQRAAYRRLTSALDNFIAHEFTGNDLYPGPYGSGGLYLSEEHAAADTLVLKFLKSPPRSPTAAQLADANAALNQIYRQLFDDQANLPSYDQVSPDNLRTEERAWLAYRDAFVAFGKTLYPSLPSSAWLLALTNARTTDLKQVHDSFADYPIPHP